MVSGRQWFAPTRMLRGTDRFAGTLTRMMALPASATGFDELTAAPLQIIKRARHRLTNVEFGTPLDRK
ncbi:hypothetical protein Acor_61610 [Acrocarpospora corrugata]|uniref:Uncharacterized protein n=1 Tax=Acrocarpospora corrugata TaxID=35763 RepID=A0A5M3W4V4_9ACTN|nr:hypothetical protein Acor_61610 [Acrocarpospora corrugata]